MDFARGGGAKSPVQKVRERDRPQSNTTQGVRYQVEKSGGDDSQVNKYRFLASGSFSSSVKSPQLQRLVLRRR